MSRQFVLSVRIPFPLFRGAEGAVKILSILANRWAEAALSISGVAGAAKTYIGGRSRPLMIARPKQPRKALLV